MSCGADKLSGDGDAAEYPCLKPFRYRRLISMLWLQGFEATAESYVFSSFVLLSLALSIGLSEWIPDGGFLNRSTC